MFVLFNTATQQVVPYPRHDTNPVEGLDSQYIVLEVIQQNEVPVDPAVQDLIGTETVDLDNFKFIRGWEVVSKPRDPLYDNINPTPDSVEEP